MAQITFEGPAVLVRDMKASRKFYEVLLGQEVRFEVGDEYVQFATGFSLWAESGARQTIYGTDAVSASDRPRLAGQEEFELYFETDELEAVWTSLSSAGGEVVHEIRTHPWGQRCFRVRDPEGILVEIGEPMSVVALRFLGQGLSIAETAKRTLLPESMVLAIIEQSS